MNPSPSFIRDVIQAAGGALAIAKRREIGLSAVHNWPLRGRIPADHCPTLEQMCAGTFVCEQMRPDVEWSVIRGQSTAVFSSAACPDS
ncbi:YdaS family helix-turn-helix protein [Microvirgula aerodenitrificans]|uniref:YdaS family helix-turn-helix protein n=1 Tax=Microvirgula aerodenitrificans TaxID=57480 RepID=UPI0009FFDF7F|nr:YdaS family helix-turn-helix protein [Microvirgula aerodenitrificans]